MQTHTNTHQRHWTRNTRARSAGRNDLRPADETDLRVLTTDRLRHEDVLDLVEGRRLAIRIPGYCPPGVCQEIASRVDADPNLSDYENAPIARLGMAFYEVVSGGLLLLELYFSGVSDRMDYIRSLFGAFSSPLDRLCRELDERWPSGARTLRLAGRRMSAGLFRNFKPGSYAEPHQDVLEWDAPNEAGPTGVIAQIAGNVYLRPSTTGGELQLWDTRLSKTEYDARRETYGVRREMIPPPSVTIEPQTGELILFCASKIHAVLPTEGASRITITCFVGYRGRDRSLVFWS